MTDRISEIRARCNRASPGKWDEEWKCIPWSADYQVSDHGNVRSFLKKGNHADKSSAHPRTLRQSADAKGYKSVSIPNINGSYTTTKVHSLVMRVFVGACPNGMEVAHLNGNSLDNRLSNLQYVTHKENERHKIAHGTIGRGERNGNAVLLGWQVEEIKYLSEHSVPQGKIAALFDISHKRVSDILSGRIWQDSSARSDVPALLDEIERLTATKDELLKEVVRFAQESTQRDLELAKLEAEVERLRAELSEREWNYRLGVSAGADAIKQLKAQLVRTAEERDALARYINALDIDEDICKHNTKCNEYEHSEEDCIGCIIDALGHVPGAEEPRHV